MPAASWSTLQEYEDQFDDALAAILTPFAASPYSFTLYSQQSTEAFVAPRVEYQFTLGAPAGPSSEAQLRAVPGLAARAVAFNFTLRFAVVTDRKKLTDAQRPYKGALRELLAPPAPGAEGAFSVAHLPYLNVTALAETQARRGFLSGDEKVKQLDVWESEWAGIFNLRADAFPD